jgi:hypothetical protein
MNYPERLLTEIPALVGELPSRVSELPTLVSEVPARVRKATRPRRRAFGPKRIVMLVAVLGAVGAVVYLVRARRSRPDESAGEWQVHEESTESAHEMRVREAGSATA